MDYSSPSQFDRHWAQRVQKEQKAFQNQSNGFNTLKTHNDTHDFMKMQEEPVEFHEERSGGKAKDYSTIKSFKASSCSSRSSNSVNTFSSKSKLSSKHGSSSSSKYNEIKEELEKEKVMRKQMQAEIKELKRTLTGMKQ
mmetsp:Transcript_28720/g.25423  ORF Transcript_28720/g.25423 Transcript_28720/m.25423 type:complete len:139 (-) Transcript_28720:38-454(-)